MLTPGENASFGWSVRNSGPGSHQNVSLDYRIFLSVDDTLGSGDIELRNSTFSLDPNGGGFQSGDPIADLDGNGIFDLADIGLFVSLFSGGC